ncbi:MAG TPA: hypothetical protein PK668_23010 [Myxococcota bacterium]|nr:hypothetical protein [Myxococcota bacterium]HRY95566.1 hypothetical protein [Myxococcota bacterium]HSA22320.1 hypothetical protein [Myxococcota bacterium]
MQLVCSYCGVHISVLQPLDDERISHGICQDCADFYSRQSGQRLGDLVNRLGPPVLILDGQARVLAASRDLLEHAGVCLEHPGGLLAGEVLECVYARRPEGCGGTVHCAACAIRRLVTATSSDGQRREEPASLVKPGGPVALRLTAERLPGPVVRLVVEPTLAQDS